VHRFTLYSSVLAPDSGLRGRPRDLTADDRDDIRDLLRLHPDYYIDEVMQWLVYMCSRRIAFLRALERVRMKCCLHIIYQLSTPQECHPLQTRGVVVMLGVVEVLGTVSVHLLAR
jgi:hypothetical protein